MIALILPKAFDFIAAGVVEGLNVLRIRYTSDVESNGSRFCSMSDSRELIKSGAKTIIVLGLGTDVAVRDIIPDWRNVIVIDGTDHSDFEYFKVLGVQPHQCRGLLKREYIKYWDARRLPSVYPFPMCITSCDRGPIVDKDIFLSFMCNERTNPLRGAIKGFLQNFKFEYPDIHLDSTNECAYDAWNPRPQNIDTPLYHQILGRSLISVSVPGAGYDCKRYWEIVGMRALLVSYEHHLVIPNDFENGKHKIEISRVEDIEAVMRNIRSNLGYAIDLINSAFEHGRLHHSVEARASQVLELLY